MSSLADRIRNSARKNMTPAPVSAAEPQKKSAVKPSPERRTVERNDLSSGDRVSLVHKATGDTATITVDEITSYDSIRSESNSTYDEDWEIVGVEFALPTMKGTYRSTRDVGNPAILTLGQDDAWYDAQGRAMDDSDAVALMPMTLLVPLAELHTVVQKEFKDALKQIKTKQKGVDYETTIDYSLESKLTRAVDDAFEKFVQKKA